MYSWDGHRGVGDLRGRSPAKPNSPLEAVQGQWDSEPLNKHNPPHIFNFCTIWASDMILVREVWWVVLTFAGRKSVPIPAPFCSTRDRDTCSIAVVRHVELVPQLCTPVAEQRVNQEGIYLLNLNFKVDIGAVPVVSFHIWPLGQINQFSFLALYT